MNGESQNHFIVDHTLFDSVFNEEKQKKLNIKFISASKTQ